MHTELDFAEHDGLVTITINRPAKRNALHRQLLTDLRDQLLEYGRRDDLRLVILQAHGSVFCSGMDLGEMQANAVSPQSAELWRNDSQLYHNVVVNLFRLKVPTLAVVQGPAIAGGVGLILACDLVLAADTAVFALPEPKRGITAAMVTPLLVAKVGAARASWLLMSGQGWTPAEALAAGLCHRVCSVTELAAQKRHIVESILSGSPQSLAATKQAWRSSWEGALLEQFQNAVAASAMARRTADAREGLQAFLEKREPGWIRKLPVEFS